MRFPKSYAFGIAVAVILLANALLIGVYVYMQYSLSRLVRRADGKILSAMD